MKSNMIETVLGGVVLLVAAVFVIFAYTSASLGTTSGYEVSARFDRVGDLKIGDDVRMSGIKIGSVVGQRLDPKTYQAVVTLSVDPNVQLPADTAAEVTVAGLLGSTYVSLAPGGSDRMIPAGGEITITQGAVNLVDLIGKAMFSSQGGLEGVPPSAPGGGAGTVPMDNPLAPNTQPQPEPQPN